MVGCRVSKQSENQSDGLITIDVTKNYPQKDLILQDFLDVEYIPLETNDEFICEGLPLAIGENIILIRNATGGDIFIFERNGKAIRKINRYGQSGEEYLYNYNCFLDEDNDQIFICDKKILVYDLYGDFKRSFEPTKDARLLDVINYDEENFIWWNSAFKYNENAVEMPSFFITSKQDGRIVKEIDIPIEHRKSPVVIWKELDITYSLSPNYKSIIPYKDQMILVESSSDTVYKYTRDNILIPFLTRTPSIQSMNPEVFVLPGVVTDRYCFMKVNTKKKMLTI